MKRKESFIETDTGGNMTDRCQNCKYFHPLKHNFKQGQGFEQSHACDVLLHMDGDGWIQEVTEDSMCEMFTPKEETK